MTINLSKEFIISALLAEAIDIIGPNVKSSTSRSNWIDFLDSELSRFQALVTDCTGSIPVLTILPKNVDVETLYKIAKQLDSKYGKHLIIEI